MLHVVWRVFQRFFLWWLPLWLLCLLICCAIIKCICAGVGALCYASVVFVFCLAALPWSTENDLMAWEHSVELFYLLYLRGLCLLSNYLATALNFLRLVLLRANSGYCLSHKLLLLKNDTCLGDWAYLLLALLLLNCLLRRLPHRCNIGCLLLGWRGYQLLLSWHLVSFQCCVQTFIILLSRLYWEVLTCTLLFVLG